VEGNFQAQCEWQARGMLENQPLLDGWTGLQLLDAWGKRGLSVRKHRDLRPSVQLRDHDGEHPRDFDI
jgi:hypothetical protein